MILPLFDKEVRLLCPDDFYCDRELDVGMQPDGHLMGPEGLDRLSQLELETVDLDASLFSDGVGDVGRCHRAE